MIRLRSLVRWVLELREQGQATIFASVIILFVIVPLTGLVIEGGRLFVSYRQMQSAADMAALTGAQDLDGTLAGSTTAISDACSYVQLNGFSNCSSGNTKVCAPPQTQSPYGNFVDYGSSSSCTTAGTSYIEVQVQNNLGTIPIFGIPVTLSTHAVARSGIPDISDYAVVALDPDALSSGSPAIKFNNNKPCNDTTKVYCVESFVAEGAVSSNATTNGISTGNSTPPYQVVCQAGWFDNASESAGSQLDTLISGSLNLAPASCSGSSGSVAVPTFDSPVVFQADAGAIADPYGSSCPPLVSATTAPNSTQTGGVDCGTAGTSNMTTNCAECSKTIGSYYDRANSTWASISGTLKVSGTNVKEIWPGIYPGDISMDGGTLYMNPGVYTFRGQVKVTGGNICVYGAPVCHTLATGGNIPGKSFTCGAASFNSGDAKFIDSGQWYYNCSPYGVWDSSCHGSCATRSAANIQTNAPTFLDESTSLSSPTASSILLNGVTLFFQCDTGCSANGNQFTNTGNGVLALPAPNPYQGTGAGNCSTSAEFPKGTNSCNTTIPEVAADFSPGSVPAPTAGEYMYPNVDFRSSGEPATPVPAVVWRGELGKLVHQHLHFLVFSQNKWTSVGLTGGGSQEYIGILHTFPAYSSFPDPPASAPVDEACPNCTVSIGGNSGGGGGPPMLMGQIISDTSQYSGNSIVEVFNRPGGQPTGPGTSLVQ